MVATQLPAYRYPSLTILPFVIYINYINNSESCQGVIFCYRSTHTVIFEKVVLESCTYQWVLRPYRITRYKFRMVLKDAFSFVTACYIVVLD